MKLCLFRLRHEMQCAQAPSSAACGLALRYCVQAAEPAVTMSPFADSTWSFSHDVTKVTCCRVAASPQVLGQIRAGPAGLHLA